MSVEGRASLITGAGIGSGIGRAWAEAYAAEGAKVVAADIDAARLLATLPYEGPTEEVFWNALEYPMSEASARPQAR